METGAQMKDTKPEPLSLAEFKVESDRPGRSAKSSASCRA